MADARTLACPSCGAPAAAGQTGSSPSSAPPSCVYCACVLMTVACPGCLGLMFVGSKHCPHCGAAADRVSAADAPSMPCPRCSGELSASEVGETLLRDCPACGGVWVAKGAFEKISADREKQAAVLVASPPSVVASSADVVKYIPCPACGKHMTRRQLARGAKIVVDVCRADGIWFDRDELRQAVEFIRSGGLDRAREKEMADIRTERARLEGARRSADGGGMAGALGSPAPATGGLGVGGVRLVLDLAGDLLRMVFR